MPTFKNLVISGGGMSGFGFLGILKYLQDIEILYKPKNFLGTSMGSIICFFIMGSEFINPKSLRQARRLSN